MAKSGPVTAIEVAQRAGVSRMTVSSVLSGTRGTVRVSEATRERVRAAAQELGYSPHPVARALRSQRSQTIGFIPRPARGTPYEQPVSYLLDIHVARAAMRHGYHVVDASAETPASRTSEELVRLLSSWRVDGVIFDSPESADEVERFVDQGLPIVQLMRPQLTVPTSTITVDAIPGIDAAVDHLHGLGHRRIAFLGGNDPHLVIQSRLKGFEAALHRHRIPCPDEYRQLGTEHSIAEGESFTQFLLKLPNRPTAIMTAGDNLTLGALRALYEAHLRVPEDMSLISYDDTFVESLYPPIAGIAQPLASVAEQATTLILQSLGQQKNMDIEPTHVVLPTRFNARASTSPPAANAR